MFYDRTEAGEKLATRLTEYRDHKNTIVLALPRGGVMTAFEVAQALHLPLDIVVARKIGAPQNPEFAIGAITENGEGLFDSQVIEQYDIPQAYIVQEIEKEMKEAQRRLKLYRQGRPALEVQGKTILLVDDGIATGSTMRAAIASLRAQDAKKIVVAAPVISPDVLKKITQEADDVVYFAAPPGFMSVGQFYQHFPQTSDEEVITIMKNMPIQHETMHQ